MQSSPCVFMKRVLCGTFILIASCISTAAADTSVAPTRTYKPDMVDVLTQRYNNARTGSNIAEHVLTVASLHGGKFQRLYHVEVEGQIYAQPLVAHVHGSGQSQFSGTYWQTEVWQREGNDWKMVHYHVSPVQGIQE